MFPGTNFQPPHFFYKIEASTPSVSSGGDVNYNAQPPGPSGVTKFHWKKDYVNNSTWSETSFSGWDIPDNYGYDGVNGWAPNTLANKIAKDLRVGGPINSSSNNIISHSLPPSTFVIEIPEDTAMGTKNLYYYLQAWTPDIAVQMGLFPYGSTIIIHNHGIIASGGGPGGRGGGVYVAATPNNDALGGGGGGGSGLQDWDLPFQKHERGDNYGVYPLDAKKDSPGGPLPDVCFPGSAGTPSMQITVFNSSAAANGVFGKGNLVSTGHGSYANGGVGSALNGITHAGSPAADAVGATAGAPGGIVFGTVGQSIEYWIYNHSTGKILGGGGGGGGGGGQANDGKAGGDGGPPGEAGDAGTSAGGFSDGGGAGNPGRVFGHNGYWDPAGANQSKFIIKQNDGIIKGLEGDSSDSEDSTFNVGTEH